MDSIVVEEPRELDLGVAEAAPIRRHHRTFWGMAWDVLLHRPTGMLGLIILLFFIGMASIGPLFYSDPLPTDPGNIFAPLTWQHPLGTDFQGTDTWSLIVTGSRY